MADELCGTKIWNIQSIQNPKLEVTDETGATITLASVTYALINSKTGGTVLDGIGTVNNTDTDPAGNTIKTVTATLDLSRTEVVVGIYWMWFFPVLSSGSSDVLRFKVKIVEYRGAS